MPQQLRAPAILIGDHSSKHIEHIKAYNHLCKSSSKDSGLLFRPLQEPAIHTYLQALKTV